MTWHYSNLLIKKYYSKPKQLKNIEATILANKLDHDSEITKQKTTMDFKIDLQIARIKELQENPGGIFENQHISLINDIKILKKLKKSKDYIGAVGELRFMEEMKKLNNDYYILSDVHIELEEYIFYKRSHNLKSAQMDFVIVCTKGVFVVEVKNWGNNYQHKGFSPYEQVDRAGTVMYKYLRDRGINRRTNKFLISIQSRFSYNKDYKSVFVNTHKGLVGYLQKRQNRIPPNEVNHIVEILKKFTKGY